MGPLDPAVYWRRRAVALGGLVVVLLMLVWLVSAVAGGSDRDGDHAVRPAAAGSTSPTPTPTGTSTSSTTATTTSTSTTTGTTTPKTTTGTSSTTTTTSTQPPGPPKPCPDKVVEVAAKAARPEYQVGQKPDFRLVLTNTGDVPCTRNLDGSLMELLVYGDGGDTRLWGSDDCYPDGTTDKRTLEPGEQAVFPITWSGLSSQPRCAGQRVTVPAGDYQLVGKFGDLTSEPTPFRLIR